jgi:hypothetical protein
MADTPSSLSLIIGSGLLVTIGGAAQWLWGEFVKHRATRESKIEAREGDYVAKIEARMKDLETRFEDVQHQVVIAERRATVAGQLCLLAIEELERTNPTSVVISHARAVLRREFPEMFELPADMADQLNKLR